MEMKRLSGGSLRQDFPAACLSLSELTSAMAVHLYRRAAH